MIKKIFLPYNTFTFLLQFTIILHYFGAYMNYKIFFLLGLLCTHSCSFSMDFTYDYPKTVIAALVFGVIGVYYLIKMQKPGTDKSNNQSTMDRREKKINLVPKEELVQKQPKEKETDQSVAVDEDSSSLSEEYSLENEYKELKKMIPSISPEKFSVCWFQFIEHRTHTIEQWFNPVESIIYYIFKNHISLDDLRFFQEYTPENKKLLCQNILKHHGFLDACFCTELPTSKKYILKFFELCKSCGVLLDAPGDDDGFTIFSESVQPTKTSFLERVVDRYCLYNSILKSQELSLLSPKSPSGGYRQGIGYVVQDQKNNQVYPFYRNSTIAYEDRMGKCKTIDLGDGWLVKGEFQFIVPTQKNRNAALAIYKNIAQFCIDFLESKNVTFDMPEDVVDLAEKDGAKQSNDKLLKAQKLLNEPVFPCFFPFHGDHQGFA